jgi:GTP-binding protein
MSISFKQARFVTSAFELSQLLADEGAEVAFAGRSNAGKSSAINCLTRQKGLCKTSKTPGRTQLINFFELDQDRRLVDLPGYGYARVSKKMRGHWNQVLTAYLLERQALQGLVIVVDIRRGISDLDQGLIDMMGDSLPLHILLTKADKLSRSATLKMVADTEARLSGQEQSVSTLSILNRQGLESLEQVCRQWLEPGSGTEEEFVE